MPFAEVREVSNETGGGASKEIQDVRSISWKSRWSPGYPDEWYDPEYKARDARERLHLSVARDFGRVPPYRRYVYFLHDAANGLIKIGISDNVRLRRRMLARQRRAELTIIGYIDGTLADEAAWHARFADIMVEREWFRATPALLAAIAASLSVPPTDGDDNG